MAAPPRRPRWVARFLGSCYFGERSDAYTGWISGNTSLGGAGRCGGAGGGVFGAARAARARACEGAVAGCDGGVCLRSPNDQFSGGPGDERPFGGSGVTRLHARAGGGGRGADRNPYGASAGFSGWRRSGARRERHQYGDRGGACRISAVSSLWYLPVAPSGDFFLLVSFPSCCLGPCSA